MSKRIALNINEFYGSNRELNESRSGDSSVVPPVSQSSSVSPSLPVVIDHPSTTNGDSNKNRNTSTNSNSSNRNSRQNCRANSTTSGLCEANGCKKCASFNFKKCKERRFCNTHKMADMVNVIKKSYEHGECDTQPSFNTSGEKGGRFCYAHKMADIVDVQSKVCEHEECNKQPTFNTSGEKGGRFCLRPHMREFRSGSQTFR
jgi:hypothetical protein